MYKGCPENIHPLRISRTDHVALTELGSQSEETLLCIHEHSLSCETNQLAVRRQWLSSCIVWPSHSQITSLSMAILTLGKAGSSREPNLGWTGADRLGWCALPIKASTRAVEWAGTLSWWCWSARLVILNAMVTQDTSSVNGVSLLTD